LCAHQQRDRDQEFIPVLDLGYIIAADCRVDRAARRGGVSRSAWVAFTLSTALDEEE
jgi:hypothetical protein